MSGQARTVALSLLFVLVTGGGLTACGGAERDEKPRARATEPTQAALAEPAGSGTSRSPSPSPSPERSMPPAASAGGLCVKLNYERVARAIGVRFEVAAASGKTGAEQVCVLQRVGSGTPDLTLARLPVPAANTQGTNPDPEAPTEIEVFRSDYQPASAKNVPGLGKAAYSRVIAASAGAGPQAEVGWLVAGHVYVLTHTTTRTTSPSAATQLLPKLIGLAGQVTP